MALTIRVANQRLLKLAKYLKAITEPDKLMPDESPKFSMHEVRHRCGSPSCAWGWWNELQGEGKAVCYSVGEGPRRTFKLTWAEEQHLFGGMHRERTRDTEVQMLRDFVSKRGGV